MNLPVYTPPQAPAATIGLFGAQQPGAAKPAFGFGAAQPAAPAPAFGGFGAPASSGKEFS